MEKIRTFIHRQSARAGLTISDSHGFGSRLEVHYPHQHSELQAVQEKLHAIQSAVMQAFSEVRVTVKAGETNVRRKGATSNTVSKIIVEKNQ